MGKAVGTAPMVLVVEDEALVRMNVAFYLQDEGYRVVEACSGDEARALLEAGANRIDVVFSGIRMPGTLDGLALADWVSRNRPGIPVILASGYWDVADGTARVPDGASRPMRKPYRMEEVVAHIKAAISQPRQGHPA